MSPDQSRRGGTSWGPKTRHHPALAQTLRHRCRDRGTQLGPARLSFSISVDLGTRSSRGDVAKKDGWMMVKSQQGPGPEDQKWWLLQYLVFTDRCSE